MRKSVRVMAATAAGILLLTLLCEFSGLDDRTIRHHQHREETGYTPCQDHGEEVFCSHLPLIFLETGGEAIPGAPNGTAEDGTKLFTTTASGETTLPISVSIMDQKGVNHHLDDEPALTSSAEIRVRGNSSRYFDKKSYLIHLTDKDGGGKNLPLLGMDKADDWALYGPYLDKSLIRNYMWYNIAGEIMDWAPNVRFCEVFLNGEYQGLYVLVETITSEKGGRLELTEPSKGLSQVSYVLRLDRGSSNPIKNIDTFTQYALRNLQDVDIVYPGANELTPERVAYIRQNFSDFEKALYSYDYDSVRYGYESWLDTQSFVDYFILNEFTCNYDAGWLSTYVYKDVRGKLKTCIWDFNSACDNYKSPVTQPMHFELQQNVWYFMLTKDEEFDQAIIDRYRQLRKSWLSDEYLFSYMDEVVEWLGPAIERNFEVWGYTLDKNMLQPRERNPRSQQEAVEQMKEFIVERGAWMDEHIEILRQYGHPSKVKKFNHD